MNFYLDYEASLRTIRRARTGQGCRLFKTNSSVLTDAAQTQRQVLAFEPRNLMVPTSQLGPVTFLAPYKGGGIQSPLISTVPRKLTRGAFYQAGQRIFTCSPGLCLVRAAQSKRFSIGKLIALAMEFASSYSTAQLEPSLSYLEFGLRPIESIAGLRSMVQRLRKCGLHGSKQAEAALAYALDGSGSYMETVLAIVLTLPPRIGGLGMPAPKLNAELQLSDTASKVAERSQYKPDIYWPALKLDIEYDGRQHENDRERAIDRRRQNDLVASGITILRASYDDLRTPYALQRFEGHLVEVLKQLGFSNARRLMRRLDDLEFLERQRALITDMLRYDPLVHPQPL